MDMNRIDGLMNEIRDCRDRMKQDWDNFDNASPEYIDVAIANVRATEQRHKALCKELKECVWGVDLKKIKEEKKSGNIYRKILTHIFKFGYNIIR